jgi:hypothetical protein
MDMHRGVVALVVLYLAGRTGASFASGEVSRNICATTPAAALQAAMQEQRATGSAVGEARGYRFLSVRRDSLLQQSWAVIESCGHAEQPLRMMLMDPPMSRGMSAPMLRVSTSDIVLQIVRAGDLVRLWKNDGRARIEMVATAEENGAIGGRVRVRLAMPSELDGQAVAPQYLAGVVRGPADVEMTP